MIPNWPAHFPNTSSTQRSYGQRDPLVEYKLEAYKTFQVMIGKIRRDTIYYLFTFQPRPLRPVETEAGLGEGEGELVQVPSNLDEKVRSYLRGLPRPLAKVGGPPFRSAHLDHFAVESGFRWLCTRYFDD
jgi:hypothetical protein